VERDVRQDFVIQLMGPVLRVNLDIGVKGAMNNANPTVQDNVIIKTELVRRVKRVIGASDVT